MALHGTWTFGYKRFYSRINENGSNSQEVVLKPFESCYTKGDLSLQPVTYMTFLGR